MFLPGLGEQHPVNASAYANSVEKTKCMDPSCRGRPEIAIAAAYHNELGSSREGFMPCLDAASPRAASSGVRLGQGSLA